MEVRVRIAPSPTGFAHIGTIYQVLLDYAFAKKHQGKFIVRIEDTDRSRFVEGAEEVVYKSLDWFKLEPDESPIKGGPYAPYRSSERLEIYKKYGQQLIDDGHAYYCFCTPERLTEMRNQQQKQGKPPMYDKHCLTLPEAEIKANLDSGMKKVIRLKIPSNEKIKVHDEIVGDLEFDSNLIDDQVLIKSDGFPTYHLAVVVDDYLMKISHVFRGTEWLPSTPKHVLIYRYLGWEKEIPVFVHVPLILNPNGQGKLSKRDEAASATFYQEEGYLPEATLNYLSNIVWNHPDGKEIYPLDEFIKLFEIKDLQPKGARFDLAKLDWMNGEYMRAMSDEELLEKLEEYLDFTSEGKLTNTKYEDKEKLAKIIPLAKERMKKLSDFIPLTDFLFDDPEYEKEVFDKLKIDHVKQVLGKVSELLEKMEQPWKADVFEKTFRDLAEELKISVSQMFQLLRVAVSGQLVTPPLFESIQILGEEETISRIKQAIEAVA